MGLGVALLGVDEVREFGGVADEEHGGVVEHPVPVALIRAQLERKTTGVARGIGGTGLTTDGGEARGDTNFLADLLEQRLGGDVAQIMGDLEVAVRASRLGVDLGRCADVTVRSMNAGVGKAHARHARGYARDRSGQGDRYGGSL